MQTGKGLFKIDAIPPTAETTIKAKLKNIDDRTKFMIYVRSEQWVGYHNLFQILVLYFFVVLTSAFWIIMKTICLLFPKPTTDTNSLEFL